MELDEVERKNRRMERMKVVTLALTGIAAVALMGHAVVSKAAEEETAPERVTVERDGVPVYSHMATTGIVVMQLMRGDIVEVERADSTSEGAWCRVREIAIWGRSGYVRCEDLKREEGPAVAPPKAAGRPKVEAPSAAERSSEVLPSTRKDSPEQTAKVTESGVAREKRYTVQVAALVVERNASALKTRLEELGFHPTIRTTTAPITRHRVYGGEFRSREEAEQTARRLNVDGVPSSLVEGDGGKFLLQVGSFLTLDEAIDLAHDLQQKNYIPKIVSAAVPTRIHAVRVGEYQRRSEALETLEALKKEGFTPVIIRQ